MKTIKKELITDDEVRESWRNILLTAFLSHDSLLWTTEFSIGKSDGKKSFWPKQSRSDAYAFLFCAVWHLHMCACISSFLCRTSIGCRQRSMFSSKRPTILSWLASIRASRQQAGIMHPFLFHTLAIRDLTRHCQSWLSSVSFFMRVKTQNSSKLHSLVQFKRKLNAVKRKNGQQHKPPPPPPSTPIITLPDSRLSLDQGFPTHGS